MEIIKFKQFPRLSEEQIREDFEEVWTFLETVHHDIEPKWNEEYYLKHNLIELAIEIRPLRSDKGLVNRYYKPFYLFRFSEKEKDRFWKYYHKLCKVKKHRGTGEEYVIPHCLYYSVYAIDLNVKPINSRGDEAVTKLAKNTAHCTSLMALDLDNVTHERYLEIKKKFTDLDLFSTDLFTGHGYQMSFVLDFPSTDLTLLEQFYHLANDIMKITEADDKVIDCARVLRCGGYNSKAVLKGDKYYGQEVIKTQVVSTTNERYNVSEFFKKCGGEYVPNKRPLNVRRFQYGKVSEYEYWDEHQGYLSREAKQQFKQLEKAQKGAKTSEITSLELRKLYPNLNVEQLPEGVKNMLYGFREGYADNALFFLTLKLRLMGYSEEVVVECMRTLAALDTFDYAWDEEFVVAKTRNVFHSRWKNAKKSDYKALEEKFGPLEIDFSDLMAVTKATTINIQRSLFIEKRVEEETRITSVPTLISKISPSAFTLWLSMLISESDFFIRYEKQKIFSMQDLIKLSGKTEKSTREAIEILSSKDVRLVDKKSSVSKKNKKGYTYYLNQYIDLSGGYTPIDKALLDNLLDRVKSKKLTERELMLYFYLRFRLGDKKSIMLSQLEIANVLGIDRTMVNKTLKLLNEEDKNLLVMKQNAPGQQNDYILLR